LCEGGKKELNGNACILHCSSRQVYLVGSEKIKATYHNIVTHYLQLLRNSIHTTATLHKKSFPYRGIQCVPGVVCYL